MPENLLVEISRLLNRHSRENVSNTPDFLLANYLHGCLEVFEKTVNDREFWYGRKTDPIQLDIEVTGE